MIEDSSSGSLNTISIIIPARNEGRIIRARLQELDVNATERECIEVIVADAASTDDTVAQVQAAHTRLKTRIVSCELSRGGTQNAGAALATGDILLFLHADTRLPLGYDKLIRDALRTPGAVAGAFSFGVDPTSFMQRPPVGLGVMAAFAQWRAANFCLPYGDQGLFMTAQRWRHIGPFPNSVMMEDFHLVGTMRRVAVSEGGCVPLIAAPALCSGRRWEKNGVLWNTFLNQVFVFAYTSLGFTASEIYQWYYGEALPAAKHRRSAAHRVKHERAAYLLTQASTPAERAELSKLREELWATADERKPVVWTQAARFPAIEDAAGGGESTPRNHEQRSRSTGRSGSQTRGQSPPRSPPPARAATPPAAAPANAFGSVHPVEDVMPEAGSSGASSAPQTPERRARYRDILDQMSSLTERLESQLSPQQSRLPSPEPSGDMAEVE